MRKLLALLLVAVAMLPAASPAQAAQAEDVTGRHLAFGSMTVPPGQRASSDLTCGAGFTTVHGGFQFPAYMPLVIVESRPANDERYWLFQAYNDSDRPFQVEIYVVCAVVTGRQVVVEAMRLLPGVYGKDAAPTCPSGKHAIGGGFWKMSASGVLIGPSGPRSTSWYLHAINFLNRVTYVFVFAVCANVSYLDYELVETRFVVPSGWAWGMDTTCPCGKVNLGGGYDYANVPGMTVNESHPHKSSNEQRGQTWTVHVTNENPQTQVVTAYAICATGSPL